MISIHQQYDNLIQHLLQQLDVLIIGQTYQCQMWWPHDKCPCTVMLYINTSRHNSRRLVIQSNDRRYDGCFVEHNKIHLAEELISFGVINIIVASSATTLQDISW